MLHEKGYKPVFLGARRIKLLRLAQNPELIGRPVWLPLQDAFLHNEGRERVRFVLLSPFYEAPH